MTKLPMARAAHLPTQHLRHQLHAVANAQQRDAKLEDLRVAPRRSCLRDAHWPAGEDDPGSVRSPELLNRCVERDDLGVDRELTQTTSDELRVLRTEIQDENG